MRWLGWSKNVSIGRKTLQTNKKINEKLFKKKTLTAAGIFGLKKMRAVVVVAVTQGSKCGGRALITVSTRLPRTTAWQGVGVP